MNQGPGRTWPASRRLFVAMIGVAAVGTVAASFDASPLAAALAQTPSPEPRRKPDLGDAAAGTYMGQIISDSRGTSSAAGTAVIVTITRTGPNRVSVQTDNPALPGTDLKLQGAMGRILATSAKTNLLLDPTHKPTRIDYSPSEQVSFSGERQ